MIATARELTTAGCVVWFLCSGAIALWFWKREQIPSWSTSTPLPPAVVILETPEPEEIYDWQKEGW